MKLIFIIVSNSILLNSTYGQCLEQKYFDSKWNIINEKATVIIEKKDKTSFNYYDIRVMGEVNNGIIFKDKRKISIENIAYKSEEGEKTIGYLNFGGGNQQKMEYIHNLLTENEKLLSPFMFGIHSSSKNIIPLDDSYYKKTTKQYKFTMNIDNFIKDYKKILTYNRIYNNQKINIHVKLIHDNNFETCSYFESPEIEYDFGMKPLSLIWNDFWNK